MNIYREIEEWIIEKARTVCPSCNDTCCSTRKNSIEFEDPSPFIELGAEIALSRKDAKKLITKEIPFLLYRTDKLSSGFCVGSRFCPAYDIERKICRIYHDKRRDDSCIWYPFNKRKLWRKIMELLPECEGFNQLEIKEEFSRRFPEISLIKYDQESLKNLHSL